MLRLRARAPSCSAVWARSMCGGSGGGGANATGGAKPAITSEVTNTPIVPVHHPEHKRVMPALLRATTPSALLTIFDEERERYGWATAKETITRIAKRSAKRGGAATATATITSDPRFAALLEVPATALAQGVMDSKARLNYQSDDLTALQAALKALRVPEEHRLHGLIERKLEEERQEEDEPGEHGSDFQGGSVGF